MPEADAISPAGGAVATTTKTRGRRQSRRTRPWRRGCQPAVARRRRRLRGRRRRRLSSCCLRSWRWVRLRSSSAVSGGSPAKARNSELVADGSLIEAPAQAYKEKPENPGGKTFEGTGDTSYAVSEGETRSVQLGEGKDTPKPGFEAVGASAGPAKACRRAGQASIGRRSSIDRIGQRSCRSGRAGRRLFEPCRGRSRLDPAFGFAFLAFGHEVSCGRGQGRHRHRLSPSGASGRCAQRHARCAPRSRLPGRIARSRTDPALALST